jgi:EpsI family protein
MSASVRFWLVFALLLGATVVLHLGLHGEEVPLARPLANFPLVLGALQGRDLPLENWELEVVHVDDYVSRVYSSPGAPPVYLYIGYYASQRAGDTLHTPRNCLPGSGWQPVTATEIDLRLPSGRRAPANFYVVEKGLDRLVVLYWYQAHGRVVANEYRAKFYTIWDAIKLNRTDATLVKIDTPVRHDEAKAREFAVTFATQVLNQLDGYLPR